MRLSAGTAAVVLENLTPGEGYDPQFGARPLKRAVQEQVLNPLSLRLLEGEFMPGDKIKVGARDGELAFKNKIRCFRKDWRTQQIPQDGRTRSAFA